MPQPNRSDKLEASTLSPIARERMADSAATIQFYGPTPSGAPSAFLPRAHPQLIGRKSRANSSFTTLTSAPVTGTLIL